MAMSLWLHFFWLTLYMYTWNDQYCLYSPAAEHHRTLAFRLLWGFLTETLEDEQQVATVTVATARIVATAYIDLLYSPVGANMHLHPIQGCLVPRMYCL